MNKFIKILLLIMIITTMFMIFSINACADSDELTIQINVYQGETLTGTIDIQAFPYEDLNITSLNEIYGEPQRASVLINGTPGIVFTWALPDSITYLTSSYMAPEVGDSIEVNIYYPAVEEDTPQGEITYGTLMLDLAVNDNDTPTNYSIFLKGIKGVDTIEGTYAFPKDGILTLTNLDVSYAWEYTFNNSTWPVDFDENNTYYNQLSVQTAPEPAPITEGNEHMVYITWEYCQEAGGNMVDGHADNAFVAGTTSFPAVSGTKLDLNDLYQNPPGATYAGDNLVQVGNNFYRMSCVYRSGNNVQAGGELENFTMIDDDLDVTFTYIFDHGVETEIEIEKQVYVDRIVEVVKEVPVDKIVEVIKEIPIEVIKEVPVEHIIEVIKEVPVDKIVEVIKEVPVEHIVTVVKEVPVEVIKEVPVDKIVEVVKEVPVEVIKTVEVEKLVTVIKEVPVEVIKEVPVEIIKEVPVEKIVVVTTEVPVEVIKEVPVDRIVEVIKEVPVEKIVEVIKEVPVEKVVEVIKEVPIEVIKTVEVEKLVTVIQEVPVEVIKEVPVEKIVEIIKEVPVEKVVEVIKEVPVEIIKEIPVEKIVVVTTEVPVEVIKEVPVDKIVEVIKEVPVEKIVEITKEVPVEKVVEVIKEVPVEIIKEIPIEVIKEVPVEKIITVTREVPVEKIVKVIEQVPVEKIVKVIEQVPVEKIKEVPVETIKEVPVEKIVTVTKEVPVVTKETQVVTVTKEVPVVVEKPVVVENHTVTTNTTTNNSSKETTTVKDTVENNTASDTQPSQNNSLEEIDEGAVPLAEFIPSFNEEPENVNTWSLVNLGLLILTFLLWFSYEPLGPGNIITGIAMLANIILYMQTQDLAGKVIWIDKWTWIMAIIYAIGLGIKYYQYDKENKKTS